MDVRIENIWLFDLFDSMYLDKIDWMVEIVEFKILNPLNFILKSGGVFIWLLWAL